MIDLKEIETYNKILKFTRGSYKPWDEKEAQHMREAAPLLKFTMAKTIRQTERNHVMFLLERAHTMNADHVIITCNKIQYFVPYESNHIIVFNPAIVKELFGEQKNRWIVARADSKYKLCSIDVNTYERFSSVLPHDTKLDGLYIKQPDKTFKLVRERKALTTYYDDCGYVSCPGTPPSLVSPDEVTKADMLKVLEAVNFCHHMGIKSIWSRALVKPLRHSITKYRTAETQKSANLIKQIIAAAK